MTRTCPMCGLEYSSQPAISRKDNKTEICPKCGAREAMASAGFSQEDIDAVIKVQEKYHVYDAAPKPKDGSR